MRDTIAKIIGGVGVVLGLLAVGAWMWFIWSFDWGHFGSRQWGMFFFFGFVFGSILVFLPVALFFEWLSTLVEEKSDPSVPLKR